MINASTVLQTPTGAGPASDGSRSAGRFGTADEQGGGFRDLLAKLSGAEQSTSDAGAPKETDNETDGEQLLDLLKGATDLAGGSGPGGTDFAALMQALTSGATAGTPNDLAAAFARMADGTGTTTDEALIQAALAEQDSAAASPERAILSALSKLSTRAKAPTAGDEDPATALLTVLRRETHLAPVQTMAGGRVHSQWASEVAARARDAARAAATVSSGDVALTADGGQPNGFAHLLSQGAVTSAGDAQLGAGWDRASSALADLQAMADAVAVSADMSVTATVEGLPQGGGATAGVVQQIADGVISEASALTSSGRPDVPTFIKHEGPMRVLHIQLQPADLGTVTIRMSVKDNALRLDLEVGRGETAHLIQRDRDALSAMLRSAGYLIEGVEVRIADPAGGGMQSGAGQTPAQGQGGQSGFAQPDARSSGERDSQGRPHNPFGNRSNGEDEQAGRAPSGGGIYL